MTNDIDTQRTGPEETAAAIALDHVTIENENAPDECALFPREASEEELMTNWITAHDESFVALESMR
ncbi:DUF7511 domain-containing protein [Halopiger djelfimassiliensis]|uniref:DUF7511 domain-containing protein n=1 Tax=Halopiger djelfimassiliensis TaxID=1293047 RepID=UPI000677FD8A|nr:hypothetical protein [Halopiger djelfimassiliensis]